MTKGKGPIYRMVEKQAEYFKKYALDISSEESSRIFEDMLTKIEMIEGSYQCIQSCAEELEKRTKWIPVSERLPDNSKPVLIYESRYGAGVGGYDKFFNIWVRPMGTNNPTHWQPFPNPPTK